MRNNSFSNDIQLEYQNVLIIDGKPDQENTLNLGKIFDKLTVLEEIKISHSRLPAIGESSFWPGYKLKSIDLSHNSISILSQRDFYNLSHLTSLDLSDNRLNERNIPSAPFSYLISLKRLSLARNNIRSIVPRMFYPLTSLEHLDLSGNPLSDIKADYFIDLPVLSYLSLEACGLKDIQSKIYKPLNNLQELNLKGNRLTFLTSFGFKPLTNLRTLHLDNNRLMTLSDETFAGLQLNHLGLSSNNITGLSACTFCSSTIESLDLSHNRIRGIVDNLLEPINGSLIKLNFNNNPSLINPGLSVSHLIKPLRKLQYLSLAEIALDDSVSEDIFSNSSSLLTLDLSANNFAAIQPSLFVPLHHLEALNLSHNSLSSLDESVLETFDSITTLRLIALHNNPWSCYRCHILPLINWLNKLPPAYVNLCSTFGHNADKFCVKCSTPSHLEGQSIHKISDDDIEFCPNQYTKIQMRLTYPQPKIGMVLGVLVIISLTFLIIIIGLIYRRQGAVYYTNEKEPNHCLTHPEEAIDEAFIIDCTDESDLKKHFNDKIISLEGSPNLKDNYISAISPSTLSPYSTYTSFEPRLRY
ncbi:carboxypeptidase N subunit 2 isoform X2 [Tetranychus urticae]|uniref:carboxypeptidase N subunit 2 isoform X2 n=1 Tax=Tetranychus urticae TaxID=32264 RepID=UPI00077BC66F|nr:carboxypeptidase N subunit 2 isoform X2 [Tetranychus urticae]